MKEYNHIILILSKVCDQSLNIYFIGGTLNHQNLLYVMIKQVIDQWYKNKSQLEAFFRETPQSEYSSYVLILKKIIELVLNDSSDDSMKIDPEEISVIDNGNYQGTQIFFFHKITYQPEVDDYYWTNNYYGSCSGCDTLLGISQYETGLPTNDQVFEYMSLSLNLVQKIKKL